MSQIIIKPRHFTPRWHSEDYPVFRGNLNSAADMENVDLTSPSSMTQGKGIAALTNGTQAGAITTLLRGMTKTAVTDNVAYGVGGAKLQQFSATAVTNTGIFPHTITGTGTITGEDVVYYDGKLYYSYNDSNTPSGDVGRYDLSTTFVDSYFVGELSGTALQNAPHQMVANGDMVFIANGKYVAVIDLLNTTATDDGLDLVDGEISSMTWNSNLKIASNSPAITGANVVDSKIYSWDGYDDSWIGDPISVGGRIGALYTKNGVTFVWYESRVGASLINTFGYLGEGRVIPLATFDGDCPEYYQVAERGDYIIWLSGDKLYAYGSLSEQPVGLSQLMTSQYSNGGGISAPFGEVLISSYASTNFSLVKESGYTVSSSWKSMVFPMASGSELFQIDNIVVFTEELSSGAKMDTVLRYNSGIETMNLDQIAYSASKPIRHIIGKGNLPKVSDFRLELSFANGSVTNPVKVKQIEVQGHSVPAR